jgi:uncharacterized membrane protein (DUF2068 family)
VLARTNSRRKALIANATGTRATAKQGCYVAQQTDLGYDPQRLTTICGSLRLMADQKSNRVLWLIAVFKLLEGLLIFVVAVGALKLLHRDVASMAAEWITALRIDPHNEYIHWLLGKLGVIDDHRLKQISAGSFIYAAIRLTEGIGLLFRQRWAEYFIVIATGLFIPLEVHEIYVHSNWPKVTVFAVNLVVLGYLVVSLLRTRKHDPQQ